MAREKTEAETPEYLPAAQVATMLDVTPQTVRMLIHRGELRGVKVGRVFRVPRDGLTAYLEGARIGAVAQ